MYGHTATLPSACRSTQETQFLSILPNLVRHARFVFRSRPQSERDELLADVIAYGWFSYLGLVNRGQDPTAFPAAFARFVVLAVKSGKRLGGGLSRREIYTAGAFSSSAPQRRSLEALSPRDELPWNELLAEKRAFSPAETAALRIDFQQWRTRLAPRDRRITDLLAQGESATSVARTLGVSPVRITQIRQRLAQSWSDLQGEKASDRSESART